MNQLTFINLSMKSWVSSQKIVEEQSTAEVIKIVREVAVNGIKADTRIHFPLEYSKRPVLAQRILWWSRDIRVARLSPSKNARKISLSPGVACTACHTIDGTQIKNSCESNRCIHTENFDNPKILVVRYNSKKIDVTSTVKILF